MWAGPDPSCGPHEHLVVERDEDEGSVVKRCLCEPGWDAAGPAPPCRPQGSGGAAQPGNDKARPAKKPVRGSKAPPRRNP